MSEDQQQLEAEVTPQIIKYASSIGVWLGRNNNGAAQLKGRWVFFGLANDGSKASKVRRSSDWIGITPITITPEMVGKTIGVFTAVELKKENWTFNHKDKREVAQQNFIQLVLNKGGYAGFANSIDSFLKIIRR